jgi:F0F1-type ATP synthase assembly protein I
MVRRAQDTGGKDRRRYQVVSTGLGKRPARRPVPLEAKLVLVAKPQKTSAARFAEYSALALLLPVSTFVGYAIGYYLDKAFGTRWLQIVFLILGSAAGFVQLIRTIMRDSNEDDAG